MDIRELQSLAVLMGALNMITKSTEVSLVSPSSSSNYCLQRFSGEYGKWNVGGSNYEMVSFMVDKNIRITGLGLGNCMSVGSTTSVDCVEIRKTRGSQGKVVYRHPSAFRILYNGIESDKYAKLNLSNPVTIRKNKLYTIKVHYSTKGTIFSAGGSASTSAGGVSFKFMKTSCEDGDGDNNGNSKTAGPIRDIFFTN